MGSVRLAAVLLSCALCACSAEPQSVASSPTPRGLVSATPVATGAARPAATTAGAWWDSVTVTVTLDADVAPTVQDSHVSATTGAASAPAHIDLALGPAGRIDVYRITDLGPDYVEQLSTLKGLLKDRITLRTRFPYYLAGTVGNFRSEPGLVAMPNPNGLPAFYSRPHYLDTNVFSGIAYLTQYVQTFAYVNADHAQYVVQGITRDGRYLVDARFAASSAVARAFPTLPPDPRVANPAFDVFWINFVRELDFRPDAAFTPSLDAIDDMLATLRVAAP